MSRASPFRSLGLAAFLAVLPLAASSARELTLQEIDAQTLPAPDWAEVQALRRASGVQAPAPAAVPDEDDNTREARRRAEKAFKAPAAQPGATTSVDGGETYEIGKEPLKAENAAGLSIDILPGQDLKAGSRIAFRIATKRPGYLMLVDVDPTGKLTQIYPNQAALLTVRKASNLIRPGKAVSVPDAKDPLAGFEFVATPPEGVAMVVAILSDKPVQLIDLPDVPTELAGQQSALKYLTDFAKTLKIAGADGGSFEDTTWSFDAKLYVIR